MSVSSKQNFFTSFDKTKLSYEIFSSKEKSSKTLIAVHGLGGHSSLFSEMAYFLNAQKIDVIALTLRGHGNSEGQRGYVEHFSYFEKDLHLFTKYIQKKIKTPMYLLGQSMGGLVCFNSIVSYGNQGFLGLILTSPALGGLKKQPPVFKEYIAQWASRYFPRLTLFNELEYEELTLNEERIEMLKNDVLLHRRISPRLFLHMKDKMQKSEDMASYITLPTTFILSQHEAIISYKMQKKVFDKIKSKEKKLIVYKNKPHDFFLQDEKTKNQLFKDISSCLKGKVKKV